MLDVHLKGAFYVTQPGVACTMREQGYGRVVSTSSAAGIFGNFGQTNYGAAKMGLVGFTRVLAVEGAKYNIKANAIAPARAHPDDRGHHGRRWRRSSTRRRCRRSSPSWPTRTALSSGEIYSVGGGRVARVFIAETQGFYKAGLTIEDVRDNFDDDPRRDGLRSARQPRRGDCAVLAVLQELKPGG